MFVCIKLQSKGLELRKVSKEQKPLRIVIIDMKGELFQRGKCFKGPVRVFPFCILVGIGIAGSIIVQSNVVEAKNLLGIWEKLCDSSKILIFSGKIAEIGQTLQRIRISVGTIVEMHLISQGELNQACKNLHIRFIDGICDRKIKRFRILCRAVLIHRLCIVKLPLLRLVGTGLAGFMNGQESKRVVILPCNILQALSEGCFYEAFYGFILRHSSKLRRSQIYAFMRRTKCVADEKYEDGR